MKCRTFLKKDLLENDNRYVRIFFIVTIIFIIGYSYFIFIILYYILLL